MPHHKYFVGSCVGVNNDLGIVWQCLNNAVVIVWLCHDLNVCWYDCTLSTTPRQRRNKFRHVSVCHVHVVQFYFLEPTSSISIRNSTDKSKIEDRVLKERARRSIKIEPLVT